MQSTAMTKVEELRKNVNARINTGVKDPHEVHDNCELIGAFEQAVRNEERVIYRTCPHCNNPNMEKIWFCCKCQLKTTL